MVERTESGDIPADGFCPTCGALEDEACVSSMSGSIVKDHRARHPYSDDDGTLSARHAVE